MLRELIDAFEELKNYVFIINRGDKKAIIIKFNNDNFYHLVGLHKTNIDLYFPKEIKSKNKKYKYIKSHIEKFNNVLENEIKEKDVIKYRVETFSKILNLLTENNNTILYSLKEAIPDNLYKGDFGLFKIYEQIFCLLGLKINIESEKAIICAPQSWMASKRPNRLVENKRPIYMEKIIAISSDLYDETTYTICV